MNNIARLRRQGRVSQLALAERLGWIQSRLSNYEHARRAPGLAESRAIVAALNAEGIVCSLDDVFPPEEIAPRAA